MPPLYPGGPIPLLPGRRCEAVGVHRRVAVGGVEAGEVPLAGRSRVVVIPLGKRILPEYEHAPAGSESESLRLRREDARPMPAVTVSARPARAGSPSPAPAPAEASPPARPVPAPAPAA